MCITQNCSQELLVCNKQGKAEIVKLSLTFFYCNEFLSALISIHVLFFRLLGMQGLHLLRNSSVCLLRTAILYQEVQFGLKFISTNFRQTTQRH